MKTIFGSVTQSMLFMYDKPSPAFFHAWYTNTEFSSLAAAFQSICAFSGMSDIHCPVPAYPTADLALPVSIWRPIPRFLALTLLLHCAAFNARSQYQSWGCNERIVKDLGCREGTLQVLPGMVWSKEKLIFFFLIGPLNLALLYSFSSQRYQHTAVQLPSTGARAQLTMQKVRKSCCAMDMLPQGMPSNEADRSWNSASVIKSCAHFISCHTDSWHPRNWMLRQLTGYSIWNKKTEGKTNDNFNHSISVAMVSGAGKTEGDYFCSLNPASTEKRVSSIDAIMNLASGSCPASIIESRHG